MKNILTTLVMLMPLISVNGQVVTDVSQKVGAALAAFGAVPLTTVIQKPRQVEVGYYAPTPHPGGDVMIYRTRTETVYDPVSVTTSNILTASNIRVVKSDPVIFGTAVRTELPDKVSVANLLAQDCSKAPQTIQKTLSEAFQRTESVQFTESVTHSVNATINFNYTIVPQVFSVGGSIQVGESGTTGEIHSLQDSDTVTISQSDTVTLTNNSAVVLELKVWPIHYSVPFSTTVIVDADLSQNDRSYHLLSDILDSTNRTFQISGTIEANDSNDGVVVNYDTAFDPNLCGGTETPNIIPHYIPKSNTLLRERSSKN